jgi:hypothetical protein
MFKSISLVCIRSVRVPSLCAHILDRPRSRKLLTTKYSVAFVFAKSVFFPRLMAIDIISLTSESTAIPRSFWFFLRHASFWFAFKWQLAAILRVLPRRSRTAALSRFFGSRAFSMRISCSRSRPRCLASRRTHGKLSQRSGSCPKTTWGSSISEGQWSTTGIVQPRQCPSIDVAHHQLHSILKARGCHRFSAVR